MKAYPGSTMRFTVTEQYRNMKQVLDRNPRSSAISSKPSAALASSR